MKLNLKLQGLAQEGGFTLIEMLIVVAIIAILVAIAVPALSTAKSDAQDAKQKSVLAAISLAKNRYVLAPTTTAANLTAFDAANNDAKFAIIDDYMLTNGVAPTLSGLIDGTGKASVNINNISSAPAFP